MRLLGVSLIDNGYFSEQIKSSVMGDKAFLSSTEEFDNANIIICQWLIYALINRRNLS